MGGLVCNAYGCKDGAGDAFEIDMDGASDPCLFRAVVWLCEDHGLIYAEGCDHRDEERDGRVGLEQRWVCQTCGRVSITEEVED